MDFNPVFARRLYLCWLISHLEKPNVPHLIQVTGWPRRTLQDVIKALREWALNWILFKKVYVTTTVTIS